MEEPGQIDVIPFEPKNKYNEIEGNLKLAKGLVEDGKT